MDRAAIGEAIKKLSSLKCDGMYLSDFLLTWEKTDDELAAVFAVAATLREMRRNNVSTRVFDSGLAVSIFRDHSTRTRFSFASVTMLSRPDFLASSIVARARMVIEPWPVR